MVKNFKNHLISYLIIIITGLITIHYHALFTIQTFYKAGNEKFLSR
jgi:hypothetical protein